MTLESTILCLDVCKCLFRKRPAISIRDAPFMYSWYMYRTISASLGDCEPPVNPFISKLVYLRVGKRPRALGKGEIGLADFDPLHHRVAGRIAAAHEAIPVTVLTIDEIVIAVVT